MTRSRLVVAAWLVAATIALAVAIWLGVTSVTYADYPPLTNGSGATIGGPYTLSTVHGDRVGGATICVLAAIAAAAMSYRRRA